MGKYFTVKVKPVLPVATQIQSNKTDLAFGANDVVFDWTSFEIPRGSAKLIDIICTVRGGQTAREINFYFAKTDPDGSTAPDSIGTGNATADGTGYYRNIIGAVTVANTDFEVGLDNIIVSSLGHGAAANQHSSCVLEGVDNSGTNVGYDKLYVAATGGTSFDWNFSTGILANGAVTSGASSDITVKTVDPRVHFDVGDVVHVHDSDTAIGTIESLPDNTSILLEAANGVAIADEDEIINASPIELILCFEK